MPQAMKAPRKSEVEWEQHKEIIRHLLCDKKLKMTKMQHIMETEHSFSATLSQYRTKLKQWEFQRPTKIKDGSADGEWMIAYRDVRRREREGKKSVVYKGGVPLDDATVKKWFSHYRCNLRDYERTPSPLDQRILTAVTPPSTVPEFSSVALGPGASRDLGFNSSSSHWMHYLNFVWPSALPVFQSEANILPKLASILASLDLQQQNLFLSPRPVTQSGGTLVPGRINPDINIADLEHSYLARRLLRLVPQSSPDTHSRTASLIEKGQLGPVWMLRLLMYMSANNLFARDESGSELRFPKISDENLLNILQGSNISDDMLLQLRRSGDFHAQCLLEAMFASAIRLGDFEATRRLIRAGADPAQLVYVADIPLGEFLDLTLRLRYSREPEWNYMVPAGLVALGCGDSQVAAACFREYDAKSSADGLFTPYEYLIGALRHILSAKIPPVTSLRSMAEALHGIILESFKPSRDEMLEGLKLALFRWQVHVLELILQHFRAQGDSEMLHRGECLLAALYVRDEALVYALLIAGVDLRGIEDSLGWSPIFFEVLRKNRDNLPFLLEMGADPSWGIPNPCTLHRMKSAPLPQAIESGQVAVVEELLRRGALQEPSSAIAVECLDLAIKKEVSGAIRALLDWGVEPEASTILVAIEHGSRDVVLRILQQQNVIDWPGPPCIAEMRRLTHPCGCDRPKTPLSAVISGRHVWAIELILEKYPTTVYDCEALWCAVFRCWMASGDLTDTVSAILRRRRETHHPEGCPFEGAALGIAAARADFEMIQLLKDHGIEPSKTSWASAPNFDPKHVDDYLMDQSPLAGWRARPCPQMKHVFHPLRWAVIGGSEAAVSLMLNHEASTDEWYRNGLDLSLMDAVKGNKYSLVDLLIRSGADVNGYRNYHHSYCPEHGYAPATLGSCLYLAVAAENAQMVRQLLKAGAEVDQSVLLQCRGDGLTAFQHAVRLGEIEIVEVLLAAEANVVNEPAAHRHGGTALQWAAMTGNIALVKRLLDFPVGPDVDAAGSPVGGFSALEAAARFGRLEIVSLLLTHRVRTDGPYMRQYIRAVKWATVGGHAAIATLLRHHRRWTGEDHRAYSEEPLGEYGDKHDEAETSSEKCGRETVDEDKLCECHSSGDETDIYGVSDSDRGD